MLPTYRVIGIIQTCITGTWAELPIMTIISAMDPHAAINAAFERARRDTLARDPYAIVRWHTPEIVRATASFLIVDFATPCR